VGAAGVPENGEDPAPSPSEFTAVRINWYEVPLTRARLPSFTTAAVTEVEMLWPDVVNVMEVPGIPVTRLVLVVVTAFGAVE